MENGKSKTEEAERASDQRPVVRYPISTAKICSACGSGVRRGNAKFCLVCGKLLKEDYEPLDAIRASYHLQGKSFEFNASEIKPHKENVDLFEQNKNQVSETAWACLVYSFVPYLGILFVPLAIVVGGAGYLVAVRRPHLGGRRLALISAGLSVIVLLVQIFLWWLLYIVPELGR